jgi:hypothetical protein
LEFEDEANAYLDACKQDRNAAGSMEDHIIPLSLPVQLILKKNGSPYENTLPYFDNDAHARSMEQSETWLTLLESFDGLEESLIYETSYCMRLVINYLLWISEIISRTWEKYRHPVLFGPGGRVPENHFHWKISPRYRPLGFLMKEFAGKKGITYECFSKAAADFTPAPARVTLNFSPPSFLAKFSIKLLVSLVHRKLQRRPILLSTSEGYGMAKVMEQMRHEFYCLSLDAESNPASFRRLLRLIFRLFSGSRVQLPVYTFPYDPAEVEKKVDVLNKGMDRLIARVKGEWYDRFETNGVNLSSYLSHYLDTNIRHHLALLVRMQAGIRPLLEKLKPAVVMTPFGTGLFGVIGAVCRELEIPSLMITHGSHLPPRSRLEEIEQRWLTRYLMLSPYYRYTAAQSPWAARHAAYFGAGEQERTLNTGPVLFARTDPASGNRLRLDLGIPGEAPVIVYAVAQRKRSSVRFHVYETEDEYLQHMNDLVTAVNEIEPDNVYLVLKLHPAAEFSVSDMRSFLPRSDRLLILHQEPFNRVLSAADLLVSYCSTVIEEALFNRIPVIQYDRWARYCHIEAFNCNIGEPKDWKIDAIYYLSDPGRLVPVLRHALEHGKEASNNDELYKKHLFSPGQSRPLIHHIKAILSRTPKD